MKFKRPAVLSWCWWSPRRLAILIGFTLTALGSLGPQFYVGPIEDRSADVVFDGTRRAMPAFL
jgi:hypothetical protein